MFRAERSVVVAAQLRALVFDCDGVILESEGLHRRAYNAAFEQFGLRRGEGGGEAVHWDEAFYDILQNTGAPRARMGRVAAFPMAGFWAQTAAAMAVLPSRWHERGSSNIGIT